jgi:chromosome segregation ATPase
VREFSLATARATVARPREPHLEDLAAYRWMRIRRRDGGRRCVTFSPNFVAGKFIAMMKTSGIKRQTPDTDGDGVGERERGSVKRTAHEAGFGVSKTQAQQKAELQASLKAAEQTHAHAQQKAELQASLKAELPTQTHAQLMNAAVDTLAALVNVKQQAGSKIRELAAKLASAEACNAQLGCQLSVALAAASAAKQQADATIAALLVSAEAAEAALSASKAKLLSSRAKRASLKAKTKAKTKTMKEQLVEMRARLTASDAEIKKLSKRGKSRSELASLGSWAWW